MRLGEELNDEVKKVNVAQCSGSHVNTSCADKHICAHIFVSIHGLRRTEKRNVNTAVVA